jgi:hypothetical protein
VTSRRTGFDKFTTVRNRTSGRRSLARLITVAVTAAVPVLVAAGPALALHHDDGTGGVKYPSLGVGLTIFYFVVIPLGAFAIIAGLALLPSALSRPRYRPGKIWENGSQSFGGPPESEGTSAAADGSARGGASAEW